MDCLVPILGHVVVYNTSENKILEVYMVEDFLITDILPLQWWEFTKEVSQNKKFDSESFCEIFKETFTAISQCSSNEKNDRDTIDLIKNIGGFVSTRFLPLSWEHLAACELTDAMLTNCFCGETYSLIDGIGKWYLLTCEIAVDFNNPENEIFNFATDLEKASGMQLL